MRTVLITGIGGSGRTTIAAATALAAARAGHRTLLLTTGRDGTLDEIFGADGAPPAAVAFAASASYASASPSGAASTSAVDDAEQTAPWTPPVEMASGLWAARIATGEHFRTELTAVQDRARAVLDFVGATALEAEEATELPGAEAFALLAAVRAAHRGVERADLGHADADPAGGGGPYDDHAGEPVWDVLVIDMPPAPEAARLLALPEQLGRYLRRLLPAERQAARALHPVLAQLAGVPVPTQRLYETVAQWHSELDAVQRIIDSDALTVRLVTEPGPLAARALRSARTGLALYGCRVDAVIANRLLPMGSADPWLTAASGQQQAALKELREAYERTEPAGPYDEQRAADRTGPHPSASPRARPPGSLVREVPHLGRDPRGLADLGMIADVVGAPDLRPDRPAADPRTIEDRLASEGLLVWRLPLEGAERGEIGLVRRGDELVITAGQFRRVLPLPSALRRCTVSGAGLHEGELRVRFAPDPQLWPRRP
ncbi:ArsA family ATPase [Streptomyces zagrosensis]|nr:ArsA family ATPase [Streptomyces zagrosensis]